jgi:hypothetical protein
VVAGDEAGAGAGAGEELSVGGDTAPAEYAVSGEVVEASVGLGAGAAAAVATTEKAYGADGPLSTREIATVGTLAACLAASVASAAGTGTYCPPRHPTHDTSSFLAVNEFP